MELSGAVVDGVQTAAVSLDESEFQQLLKYSLNSILEPASSREITVKEKNTAAFKEALLGVSTLLLELARLDVDSASLSSFLEECKFSPERIKHFTTMYLDNKDVLRSNLERVGTSPPHLVNVQWRLDYYLKNNHVERVSRPEYLIHFNTQYTEDCESRVQFSCTQEQLQDLVLKLKDATKTLDKYIQH